MFIHRNTLCALLLPAVLPCGLALQPAGAATPEEVKKQQDQIRDRAKDIEEKAQADKQAREREEARKAQELRDKQSREENPANPLPRNITLDPSRQPPRPTPSAMTPPYPDPRMAPATLVQLEAEMLALAQRHQRLEQMLNAKGNNSPPPDATPPPPAEPHPDTRNRRPPPHPRAPGWPATRGTTPWR